MLSDCWLSWLASCTREMEPRGHEIKEGLECIKEHPRPPSSLLDEKTPSPRPENTTLPDG